MTQRCALCGIVLLLVFAPSTLRSQTRQVTLDVRSGKVTPTTSDRPPTNGDVVGMVDLHLSDEVVIDKIRNSPRTDFDTSLTGLKTLKAHRVSDAVIRAMIDARPMTSLPDSAPPPAVAPAASTNNFPDEVGVYVLLQGKLAEVDPEIIGWKSGGVLKSTMTLGIDKGHINGTIMNAKSSLRLTNPVEFLIRTPEGTSATEYQLLKLYEKGDRRTQLISHG